MRYATNVVIQTEVHDGENIGDDVVAIIDMLRDHFALSRDKLTRSEQLRVKEEAFLDTRSRTMEELTCALRHDLDGQEEKCSMEAVTLAMQPYASMSMQEASEGFYKLRKGISLYGDIEEEDFDEEEANLPAVPNNDAAAGDIILCGSDVTELPEDFKLTESQKECVEVMRRDMERGQMLVFVHGPPGSGKTTTARLLVSEKNLDLVFSGTMGTASAHFKAQTINSQLRLG